MTKLLSAFLLACSLGACVATPMYTRPGDLAPLIAHVDGDQRDLVWQRAIGVLLDEGYVPQLLDEHAGYISAKQRDDVDVDALAGTLAIVTVSPDGVLRVEVSGHGLYDSGDDLLRDIKAEQNKLLQKIMAPPAPAASALAPAAPRS